jgi:hypothetical protein
MQKTNPEKCTIFSLLGLLKRIAGETFLQFLGFKGIKFVGK